jgi:SAM-dependent methyltransferase
MLGKTIHQVDCPSPMICKLCLSDGCARVFAPKGRTFIHCPSCGLVFVPESEWLPPAAERARYDKHDNTPGNAGYLDLLSEVVTAARRLRQPPARVLDFGCGERAVLCTLLADAGYLATGYDPAYPDRATLDGTFDLVVLCEVIEHVRDLRAELVRIARHLAPDGRVLVRTRLYPSPDRMADWWYARDVTHINFFAEPTFAVVAKLLGKGRVERLGEDLFGVV